jgi:hypothetical protein
MKYYVPRLQEGVGERLDKVSLFSEIFSMDVLYNKPIENAAYMLGGDNQEEQCLFHWVGEIVTGLYQLQIWEYNQKNGTNLELPPPSFKVSNRLEKMLNYQEFDRRMETIVDEVYLKAAENASNLGKNSYEKKNLKRMGAFVYFLLTDSLEECKDRHQESSRLEVFYEFFGKLDIPDW